MRRVSDAAQLARRSICRGLSGLPARLYPASGVTRGGGHWGRGRRGATRRHDWPETRVTAHGPVAAEHPGRLGAADRPAIEARIEREVEVRRCGRRDATRALCAG